VKNVVIAKENLMNLKLVCASSNFQSENSIIITVVKNVKFGAANTAFGSPRSWIISSKPAIRHWVDLSEDPSTMQPSEDSLSCQFVMIIMHSR